MKQRGCVMHGTTSISLRASSVNRLRVKKRRAIQTARSCHSFAPLQRITLLVRDAFYQIVIDIRLDDFGETAFGFKPQFNRARWFKVLGQPATIFAIASSGWCLIRSTTFRPATFRRASICSVTVQLTPERFKARRPLSKLISSVAAWIKKLAAESGDTCQ